MLRIIRLITGKKESCLGSVSSQPLSEEARAQYLASSVGICGGQSDSGTEFSPSTSVFPRQIIPPVLRAHSSIYQPRCYLRNRQRRYVTKAYKTLEKREYNCVFFLIKQACVRSPLSCRQTIRNKHQFRRLYDRQHSCTYNNMLRNT
jgi:hypothetical protein